MTDETDAGSGKKRNVILRFDTRDIYTALTRAIC